LENATTVALSRLVAQQRALDVTATNIANTDTPGYKGERMVFSDWINRQKQTAAPPGGGTIIYTQDRATFRNPQEGAFQTTNNPLDVAIAGPGFFTVSTPQGPRLTRAGRFELMPDGTLTDLEANPVLDPVGRQIQISAADTGITIAADGTIKSVVGPIGKLGVVVPADVQQLKAEGGHLANANATSTTPVAAPKVVQGVLESSNVQPIAEVTRMMNDLREFQFVTQFIQGQSDLETNAIEKILTPRT
jgi:flagellar basal-body rod protein FlgF